MPRIAIRNNYLTNWEQKGSMMLIADSGGSKTAWRLIHTNGDVKSINTLGFNPYNQPISDLRQSIQKDVLPHLSSSVQHVFFYGAGVTSKKHQQEIKSALQFFFTKSAIHVHSDLLGTARALCGDAPGLVCILGTGSNCGEYDGANVHTQTPSLGWILSDEGSGSHLGKRLVNDFLSKKMPTKIANLFRCQYPWSEDKFLQHIYKGEKPATFLGSFSSFVAQHIKEPYCHQLVRSGFEDFYKKNILVYNSYHSLSVYFTGSIAFHYSDVLEQVADSLNIEIGHIVQSPIDRLVLYHQKKS